MRSSVDLPEPEPPRSANISPLWMSRLTSSTASVLSKLLDTPRMLSNTSAFAEVLIPLTTPLTPGLNAGPGTALGHRERVIEWRMSSTPIVVGRRYRLKVHSDNVGGGGKRIG